MLRTLNRLFDVLTISFARLTAFIDVGPIHREAGDGLPDGLAQYGQGEISRPAVLIGYFVQAMRKHVDLARQRSPHYQLLAVVNDLLHAHRTTSEAFIQPGKRSLVPTIDEEIVDLIAEVVTHRTVHWPKVRQMFASLKNLFHQQVERRWTLCLALFGKRAVNIEFDPIGS